MRCAKDNSQGVRIYTFFTFFQGIKKKKEDKRMDQPVFETAAT